MRHMRKIEKDKVWFWHARPMHKCHLKQWQALGYTECSVIDMGEAGIHHGTLLIGFNPYLLKHGEDPVERCSFCLWQVTPETSEWIESFLSSHSAWLEARKTRSCPQCGSSNFLSFVYDDDSPNLEDEHWHDPNALLCQDCHWSWHPPCPLCGQRIDESRLEKYRNV